ncbi:DUF58 domain-containing protein [Frankia sp. AgB32]|uniref:DUF58 domain-containing protein n=1 Tax=Frankia sp. AgB32 TaxID=631119 RepID=UPI00200DD2F4|nr:DUF58 domain-containing protein [Frankia sp. AgB32]MCK9893061.1 DUF58 domain-containing protein [Frankia sp. AgB32]
MPRPRTGPPARVAARPERASGGPPEPAGVTPARSRARLTPLGWGMLAAVTVLLAGARILRYAELDVLGGTGIASVGLAVAFCARRPRVSAVLRTSPGQVARGEPAELVIALTNLSRWSSPAFLLRLAAGPDPDLVDPPAASVVASGSAADRAELAGAARQEVVLRIPHLRCRGSRSFVLALPTHDRGVLRLGPAEVIRSDPFGLVVRRQALATDATLYVRPRVRHLAPLASAPSREPDGQTGRGTVGGLEIHTLRQYAAGEDLRLVHWPSSARTGELMVRTHVDPTEPAATVVLDVRPGAYPPGRPGAAAFEEAVEATAAMVMTCAREAFGVRLVTTAGLRVAGRRRRQDADVLLDELAAVRLDERATLDVVGTLRRGGFGTLVLVTGGFDRQALAALAPVGHAYGRVVLVRVGPRSVATARAVDRRDSSDRARLRHVPPVRATGLPGWARSRLPGGYHPDELGLRTAGRTTVIDVPEAAALAARWPAAGRSGWAVAWDGRR